MVQEAAKKVKRSRAAAKKEAAMGKEEKAKPKAQASGSKKKPTAKVGWAGGWGALGGCT